MNKESLIDELQLKPHVEGGYYNRTYMCSRSLTIFKEDGSPAERPLMTSMYYMLTVDNPIDHCHKNSSDIVHYFHLGSPLRYHVVTPEGHCSWVLTYQQGKDHS